MSAQATRVPFSFPHEAMDYEALSIVERLQQAGYVSYFVGGCVRDVLIGKTTPKDFDIATDARPQEVRRLFRNAQLIGRRFKLAHVYFAGGKTIEVATFRRPPSTDALDEGLILEDNEYGTPETDAFRRDFTVNALFYDPLREELIDYVGGLDDIDAGLIRSIGDPALRFREDPIRILRAIKFAARLGLSYDPAVSEAMISERNSIAMAASPRLQLELVRYLRGGEAHRSYELLRRDGFLHLMIPELEALFSSVPGAVEQFNQLLIAHDEESRRGEAWRLINKEEAVLAVIFWPLCAALILGEAMFSPPAERALNTHRLPRSRDLRNVLLRMLAPIATRIGLSIKTLHLLAQILINQLLIELESHQASEEDQEGADISERSRRIRAHLKGAHVYESLLLLKIRRRAGQLSEEIWAAAEPLWDKKRQELARGQSSPKSRATRGRRGLVPSKPVIRPTERRKRRRR